MPLRLGTTPNNSQFILIRTAKVGNLVVNLQTCKKCAGKSDTWHATRYQFSLLSHYLTPNTSTCKYPTWGFILQSQKSSKLTFVKGTFESMIFPFPRLVGHVIFPTFAQLKTRAQHQRMFTHADFPRENRPTSLGPKRYDCRQRRSTLLKNVCHVYCICLYNMSLYNWYLQ